jgi:hypothetical protein
MEGKYHRSMSDITPRREVEDRSGVEWAERNRINFTRSYLGADGNQFAHRDAPPEVVVAPPEHESFLQPVVKPTPMKTEGTVAKPPAARKTRIPTRMVEASTYGGGESKKAIGALGKLYDKAKGLESYLELQVKPRNMMQDNPGDGYCAAHALATGMRSMGYESDESCITTLMQESSGDSNWFDTHTIATVAASLGFGIAMGVERDGERRWHGYNTEGRPVNQIIGLIHKDNHFYTVTDEGQNPVPMDRMEDVAVSAGGLDALNQFVKEIDGYRAGSASQNN